MKLLFDENLSARLVELLAADFPGCTHIEFLGMRGAADIAVWDYARENGYPLAMWVRIWLRGSFAAVANGCAHLILIPVRVC